MELSDIKLEFETLGVLLQESQNSKAKFDELSKKLENESLSTRTMTRYQNLHTKYRKELERLLDEVGVILNRWLLFEPNRFELWLQFNSNICNSMIYKTSNRKADSDKIDDILYFKNKISSLNPKKVIYPYLIADTNLSDYYSEYKNMLNCFIENLSNLHIPDGSSE